MQQIADWLKKLGMAEYAERFAENDIDIAVLPDLTDQHLKDLGVSLGHRLKMLRAIRGLGNAAAVTAPPAPVATDPTRRDDAERRQLTVMFTDLVGSTALSTKLDPEDLRSVIGAYHKCVAKTVARFDGFVAKYMGDGVLVYFGYPQAHEDDAERAVRAGLTLIEAVGKLRIQEPLQVRIGVATGLVVVGDLVGSGEAQEHGVVGETPNLAARLQGIAAPNMVVIAEGTRRLLGNLFELEDLGPKDLKGIAWPARAWAALRARSVESRFEALHTTGLTTLVGREEEFGVLLRRWARAKTGEGQVVLIGGKAGIGKSRLTAALMEFLASEPHTRLRYFCSPQHTDSALYPIVGQMERAAGLAHDDTPQVRLDKLDAMLAQTATSVEDAALFADMLSLPNDGRYPAIDLTPQQRRQRTLESLTAQLGGLASQQPVMMIFEDVHWIDPTSLEALGRIVDRIKALPALLIVTFRPEFNAPWVGRSHVSSVTLNRLGERESATIVAHIVGNKGLPAGVMTEIVERTDGIPLFVEEMTKAVLEAESESEAKRTAAEVPSTALAVPASLHASLMARLDRLGPAKALAQIGAVIGRDFSHPLLAAVVGRPESELQSALERLIASGLLFRQGVAPQASYLFKHALVQDAAYGTLLREQRRKLHARVAETIERQFPDVAENQPELLARHCTKADLTEKAAELWGKAGQRSLERSALSEALEQFRRALDLIATLPATPQFRREQIKFQVGLITPLIHVNGYSAQETKAAVEESQRLIEQAEALGESLEDPLLFFSTLYGAWAASFVAFDGKSCLSLATQFLAVAEKQAIPEGRLIGHRITGVTLVLGGDFSQARRHCEEAIELYNPDERRQLAIRFGQDVMTTVLSYYSLALWSLGYPEKALRSAEQAVEAARETGQAASLMFGFFMASIFHISCRNYSLVDELARKLFMVADKKGALLWKAGSLVYQGCVFTASGKPGDAVALITAGIADYRSTGATVLLTVYLSLLGRAYADLGQFDEAWRCMNEASSIIETAEEKIWESEVNRVAGEITLLSQPLEAGKAEQHFTDALAVARKQQAKSWELRAAMSMARLWRDQGKRQQAHDLLAPVYCWFTEGFDTLDLKEAKALLEQLKT